MELEIFADETHVTDNMGKEARCAYKSFQKWYSDIFLLADIEIIFHEKPLVCKYFGGTIDGLYKINNKIYLILLILKKICLHLN